MNLAGDTPPKMAVDAASSRWSSSCRASGFGGRGVRARRGGQQGAPPTRIDVRQLQMDSLRRCCTTPRRTARRTRRTRRTSRFRGRSTTSCSTSLVPALSGQMPVIFPADRATDIRDAVTFAEEMKLKPIIIGGQDAPAVADFLKQHNVPVIVTAVMKLPSREDDPYDVNYSVAGQARRGGRAVRHLAPGDKGSEIRTLPYNGGHGGGVRPVEDDALKSVTLWPAQIFGVGDKHGLASTSARWRTSS